MVKDTICKLGARKISSTRQRSWGKVKLWAMEPTTSFSMEPSASRLTERVKSS